MIRIDAMRVSASSPYVVFAVVCHQIRTRWSPYLGAGVGYTQPANLGCAIPNCSAFESDRATAFVDQAKTGVSYRVTPSGYLDLEGAYRSTAPYRISIVSYDPFGFWRLNLGWRQTL